MKLSVLIPCISSRMLALGMPLFQKIEEQAFGKSVEVLSLLDNKTRSIGMKKEALLRSAQGDYVSFIDDDDDVSGSFVDDILAAIYAAKDVIVFSQETSLDGETFLVHHGIEYENEGAYKVDGVWQPIKRKPWQHCAWKASIAQRHSFTDTSHAEDWDWCSRVLRDVTTQARIDKVLHYYRFNSKLSEAG